MSTLQLQRKKPLISDKLDITVALKRVFRVSPSFLLLAMGMTIAVYALGVPPFQRTIAALVPIAVLFLISRVMVIWLPTPAPQSTKRKISPMFLSFFLFVFLGAFAALDLLFSSLVFALLSLPELSQVALNYALGFGLMSSLGVIIGVLYVLQQIGLNITELLIVGLWKIFGYPQDMANHLFTAH